MYIPWLCAAVIFFNPTVEGGVVVLYRTHNQFTVSCIPHNTRTLLVRSSIMLSDNTQTSPCFGLTWWFGHHWPLVWLACIWMANNNNEAAYLQLVFSEQNHSFPVGWTKQHQQYLATLYLAPLSSQQWQASTITGYIVLGSSEHPTMTMMLH